MAGEYATISARGAARRRIGRRCGATANQGEGALNTTHLLHIISHFGYAGYAGLVFIAAVGIPLPLLVILLAVGAWSAVAGGPDLLALALIGTAAAVAGDTLDYAVGRAGGSLLRDRALALLRRLHPRASAATLDRLWPHQGLAVFVSRCALTMLSVPVSLLAGATRMRFARFLAWETAGKGLFVVVWLLAGRVFGAALIAHGPVPTIAGAVGALAVVALALFEVRRWWARRAASVAAAPDATQATRPVAPLR